MKPSTLAQPRGTLSWVLAVLSIVLVAIGCAGGAPPVADDDDQPPPPHVKKPPTPKDGSSTVAGCEGITEAGSCQDGVAVTCDLGAGEVRRKDCKALGKSCVVDTQRGAMCEVPAGAGGGGTEACGGVTFEGTCGGDKNQTATWCDTDTQQTIVWDCDAEGKKCEVNTCGIGAFCCGGAAPPPPSNVCPALGFAGECDGNTARWCNGDQVVEKVCSGGQTCQVDACADGAYCCDPPNQVSECEQIGIRGVCTPEGHPRWCSGGQVMEVACFSGKTCQIDKCGSGAFCCDP